MNATTSEGGDFVFTALQPGTYTVSVTAQGLQEARQAEYGAQCQR
ncbi:MAG: carboxypeptidase-like regulatory domain-containing protein [Bryobacteraceae bacterium]